MIVEDSNARLTQALAALGIPASSWHRQPVPDDQRRRPGPPPKVIEPRIVETVVKTATENPWYGYQRIAVMCRRLPEAVTDEDAYRVMRQHRLLQKRRRVREPELRQALKLYELLPRRPNDLWRMDVTYVHIPGFGWWCAVTVIDYYSRYLLARHLTNSYSAVEAIHALGLARQEAERLHGPLEKTPFLATDNGSSFIAKRFWSYIQGQYSHVRIQYRTPTQLGLLERFHKTLKLEEVYWRLYDSPSHARECFEEFRQRYNERRPHWALAPLEVYTGGTAIRIPKWQAWAKGAKEKLDQMLAGAAA